jgi:Dodecin
VVRHPCLERGTASGAIRTENWSQRNGGLAFFGQYKNSAYVRRDIPVDAGRDCIQAKMIGRAVTPGWRRKKFAMPQSTHKVVHPESTYDVIELIGTSTKSWEDAANGHL